MIKWPVILLQIDVNAIPISSVVNGRASMSSTTGSQWALKNREQLANFALMTSVIKVTRSVRPMCNPINVGSVEVDRKGQAGEALLTPTRAFSG